MENDGGYPKRLLLFDVVVVFPCSLLIVIDFLFCETPVQHL